MEFDFREIVTIIVFFIALLFISLYIDSVRIRKKLNKRLFNETRDNNNLKRINQTLEIEIRNKSEVISELKSGDYKLAVIALSDIINNSNNTPTDRMNAIKLVQNLTWNGGNIF
jgi:hypothetical protein